MDLLFEHAGELRETCEPGTAAIPDVRIPAEILIRQFLGFEGLSVRTLRGALYPFLILRFCPGCQYRFAIWVVEPLWRRRLPDLVGLQAFGEVCLSSLHIKVHVYALLL